MNLQSHQLANHVRNAEQLPMLVEERQLVMVKREASPAIDFSPLFSQLFSTLWWLLPLFVMTATFKQLNN